MTKYITADWKHRLIDAEKYGYCKSDTKSLFGYEYPTHSQQPVCIACVGCHKISKPLVGNFYSKNIKHNLPSRCSKCAAMVREAENHDRYNVDWKVRCESLSGYDKDETQKKFGYEYPHRGTDLIVVACRYEHCQNKTCQPVTEFFRASKADAYRCKSCMAKDEFPIRQQQMHANLKDFWSKKENRFWASEVAKSQHDRRSENMIRLNGQSDFQEKRVEGYNNVIDTLTDSLGEREIRTFVQSLGFAGDKKVFGVTCDHKLILLGENEKKTTTEVDIYVPEMAIGIEYNGIYWHSSEHKHPNYHYNKWLFFKEFHSVKLIQLWEHEWSERQAQVKNRVRSLLGRNSIRVNARDCEILDLDKQTAIDFINREHIQPCSPNLFKKAFGLFLDGTLIACGIFARHHRQINETTLQRFACSPDTTIVGGMSRITHHASQFFKQPIYTWCDLRWSDGNGYEKSGWELVAQLPPDYFYVHQNTFLVVSKQSRKKSLVKTPDGMTESQHAKLEGFHRLYDCGKLKYVYNPR